MEENIKYLLKELKKINADNKITESQNAQVLKLAYVGDAIFDLLTRDYLFRKYKETIKINDLHKKNTELVCAKNQSRIADMLIDNEFTKEEIDFFKHARNAHSSSKSKNSSIVEYRKATGLEALLGLLFYEDENRLMVLLEKICILFDK